MHPQLAHAGVLCADDVNALLAVVGQVFIIKTYSEDLVFFKFILEFGQSVLKCV